MTNTFLISDTHFGHARMLTFKRKDGSRVREFDSVEEMDETMIQNWNKVVKDGDLIYHLGDVCMNKGALHKLDRLKGRKRLVAGNHDVPYIKELSRVFEKIYGVRPMKCAVLTHVPIHPRSLDRWEVNIHGHLHGAEVLDNVSWGPRPDKRYFNVSVERHNYTPISLEAVRDVLRERGFTKGLGF